ncbi:hypothetical protein V1515DRAFT_611988 [Lipomyces mesembrius]
MSSIFRAIFVVLALAYVAAAGAFVSSTTLCLFKGHAKHSPGETVFWLEQEYNQYNMPFYTMSELGYSEFKTIDVALNDGTKDSALIYLYHNREATAENVAFVNYDKTAYHFSGSEKLDSEKFKLVGGGKMVVDFGSCVTPEYNWEWNVASTTVAAAGLIKRPVTFE